MIDTPTVTTANNETIYTGTDQTANSSLLPDSLPVSNIELVAQPPLVSITNLIKTACINLQTNIVENIIMINDGDTHVEPDGYIHIPVPKIPVSTTLSPEQQAINEILKQLNPDYVETQEFIEMSIITGQTKWSEDKGFYE
jgi:hypothetical protein